MRNEVPEVLFVCVHQRRPEPDGGSAPPSSGGGTAHELNPRVVEAMQEIGIDISRESPKPLTDEFVRAADAVITMGCGDACPIYPGKRYEDWDLEDPAGIDMATVRRIRDENGTRVERLLKELLPLGAPPG